jgi:hypothetical protein
VGLGGRDHRDAGEQPGNKLALNVCSDHHSTFSLSDGTRSDAG